MARECDVCGALHKHEKGVISWETIYVADGDGKEDTWSDVDLCKTCSDKVLAIIKPALEGFGE